jgi:hypothetical protein
VKKFLMIVLVLVIALVGVGLASSTDYSVESSMLIDAPASEIHAYLGELRKWPEWSPWDEADASIVTTFGDKTTGVGAFQSWTSDDGDGELTLTTCDVDTGVAYDMVFINGDERTPASAVLAYRAVDGGTEVTWSMEGDWKGVVPPVMDGWMQILTPVMIGGMFDDGLAKLKVVVEASGA